MVDRRASVELRPRVSQAIPPTARPGGIAEAVLRRRRTRLFSVCLALALTAALAPRGRLSAGELTQAYAEAELKSCGPRAVYALAQRLGCDLTYETVREGIRLGDKGCSIDDVKNSLIRHGVHCSVRRLDPTQLLSAPTPLIVHIMPRGSRSDGHFIIVTRIGTDGLQTFDPMMNRDRFWIWRSFSDWWSGYAVVPTSSPISRDAGLVGVALGVHLLAFAGLLVSIGGSSWSWSRPAGRSRRTATTILALVTSGMLATPVARADEGLRSLSNDGVNAAALLGGLCGAKIPPGQAAGGEACDTLTKVQRLLSTHGVATSVRRLGYEDLIHRTGPCIVPLRFGKSDVGIFYVLLNANSKEVSAIRGGPLLVDMFSVDEFRRHWTGYGLIPIRDDHGGATYLAAAGALIIPALVYAIGRRGRRAAKTVSGAFDLSTRSPATWPAEHSRTGEPVLYRPVETSGSNDHATDPAKTIAKPSTGRA